MDTKKSNAARCETDTQTGKFRVRFKDVLISIIRCIDLMHAIGVSWQGPVVGSKRTTRTDYGIKHTCPRDWAVA